MNFRQRVGLAVLLYIIALSTTPPYVPDIFLLIAYLFLALPSDKDAPEAKQWIRKKLTSTKERFDKSE